MNGTLTPTQLIVGMAVLVGLFALWRISAWKRRRTLAAARASARLLSLFGRVVFTAALIVGVQWIVIVAAPNNRGLLLAALGLPALFAAYAMTRALTVTTVDTSRARGGRR